MPKRILLVTCLVCWLAGCDALVPDEPVPFTHVERVNALRVQINGTTMIRDRWDWEAFWQRHGGALPAPAVDFERQTVLGVFYGGSLYGGCHSDVEVVEAVRRDGDALEVRVGPLPDLGICRQVVYPLDIVVVDVPAREVRTAHFKGRVPSPFRPY